MSTHDRVKKLLDHPDLSQTERGMLVVLNNAVIATVKAYNAEPTAIRKKDWDAAVAGLEAEVSALWARLIEPPEKEEPEGFTSLSDVLRWLKVEGWKVAKTALYSHAKEGKLRPSNTGLYELRAIERYARTWLKRVETGQKVSEEVETLQRRRLEAEIRAKETAGDKLVIELDVLRGRYLFRDDVELEHAARALLLRDLLRHEVRINAAEWIRLCGGDADRERLLVESIRDILDQALHRYAVTEWEVTVPNLEPDTETMNESEDVVA